MSSQSVHPEISRAIILRQQLSVTYSGANPSVCALTPSVEAKPWRIQNQLRPLCVCVCLRQPWCWVSKCVFVFLCLVSVVHAWLSECGCRHIWLHDNRLSNVQTLIMLPGYPSAADRAPAAAPCLFTINNTAATVGNFVGHKCVGAQQYLWLSCFTKLNL